MLRIIRLTVPLALCITVVTEPTYSDKPKFTWPQPKSAASSTILKDVEKLQAIAKRSCGGAMGCGIGWFEYAAYNGKKRTVRSGLDPMHVFGRHISAKTISTFLDARVAANKTKKGAMTGDKQSLLYVVLSVVASTKDPAFIKSTALLLEDPLPFVRGHAAWALFNIGNEHAQLRVQIISLMSKHKWDPHKYETTLPKWFPKGT